MQWCPAAFILGINRCAVVQELLDTLFVALANSIVELCLAKPVLLLNSIVLSCGVLASNH